MPVHVQSAAVRFGGWEVDPGDVPGLRKCLSLGTPAGDACMSRAEGVCPLFPGCKSAFSQMDWILGCCALRPSGGEGAAEHVECASCECVNCVCGCQYLCMFACARVCRTHPIGVVRVRCLDCLCAILRACVRPLAGIFAEAVLCTPMLKLALLCMQAGS